MSSASGDAAAPDEPPRKRRYSRELLEAIEDNSPNGSFDSAASPLLAAEWKVMAADLGLIMEELPPAAITSEPTRANFVVHLTKRDPTEEAVHKQHAEWQRKMRSILQHSDATTKHILADAVSSDDPCHTIDCLMHLSPSQRDVLATDAKALVRGLVDRVQERRRGVEAGRPPPRVSASPA